MFIDSLDESHESYGTFNTIEAIQKLPIPGFSSAQPHVIKKSLKRLYRIFKNDFKCLVFAKTDKTMALRACLVDNTLILAEIGVDVANSAVDAVNSQLSLEMSIKYGEIVDLFIEKQQAYYKASSYVQKVEIKNNIQTQCESIKLDGSEAFWATLRRTKDTYNSILKNHCLSNLLDMEKEDSDKGNILRFARTWNQEKYNTYVKYYFRDSEQNELQRLYTVANFDVNLLVSENEASYKKLQRAIAHGFGIKQFLMGDTVFIQGKNVSKNIAHNFMFITMLLTEQSSFEHLPYKWNEYLNSEQNTNITRIEFASLIIQAFQLKETLSELKKSYLQVKYLAYNQPQYDWPYEAVLLNHFKIINNNTSFNFRSDNALTRYELLVMLVNTLDLKKCGYVGCDITKLFEVKK
jgi:hypothetical protein